MAVNRPAMAANAQPVDITIHPPPCAFERESTTSAMTPFPSSTNTMVPMNSPTTGDCMQCSPFHVCWNRVLVQAERKQRIAAQEPEEALAGDGVKGAQVRARCEIDKRRRNGHDGVRNAEHIEVRSESRGLLVQVGSVDCRPTTGVEPGDQGLHRGNGFRGREGTVA